MRMGFREPLGNENRQRTNYVRNGHHTSFAELAGKITESLYPISTVALHRAAPTQTPHDKRPAFESGPRQSSEKFRCL